MTMPQSGAAASRSVDRTSFENFYAEKPPWEIGKPQPAFVAIADRLVSPILDAGCGTGENSLFFAGRGHHVVGIDFVEEVIRRARQKCAERGLSAQFLVKDALTLSDWGQRFASAIDCGLFHVFSDDDRRRYVEGLSHVVDPGGRLFLLCFSDAEPGVQGPRRVSRQELHDSFGLGWEVESIQPTQIEVRPDFTQVKFSEGGPKAWSAIIRRKDSHR